MKFTTNTGREIVTHKPYLLVRDSVTKNPKHYVEIYLAEGVSEIHEITEKEWNRLIQEYNK